MRWTTKLSCDVKLCQELQCRKLLKSDNYSSTYSQQYVWVFFSETRCNISAVDWDTINPLINAPGIYSYNRSEPPAFIWDPAFIKSCCICLLHKNLCSCLLVTETNRFLRERDYVTFSSLLSQFRLSSVMLVHPTQGVEPFGNITRRLLGTRHLSETRRLIETRSLFVQLIWTLGVYSRPGV